MRKIRKLQSDFSLLRDLDSWNDKMNETARECFKAEMKGREYGYEALHDAWNWFLTGYDAGARMDQ